MTTGLHLVVDTLAGSATVAVHFGLHSGRCLNLGSMLLDPDQVLELATKLTLAAVPPPPVVAQRVQVRKDPFLDVWTVDCPECFPIDGAWHDHPDALAAAERHLRDEHADEREVAA